MRRFVLVVVVLALVGAACAGSEPETLTIYSGRSEDLVGPLVERFEEESGIDVEVRYADSAELATTLTVEGDASPADVFFAQDPASLGLVASEGLFVELPSELLEQVPDRFRDAEGRWVGTSGRVRTFVYDSADVAAEELPQTIWDVTGDRWAGELGIAPTNGSFLAFVAAMILDEGEARTAEWLAAVAANDPSDRPKNSAIVEAVDLGEIDAGLVNHYYLLQRRAELGGGSAENWFIPAGDAGSLVMPAGVGVIHESDAATAFVEFLLSEASQEFFATETFEYPLIAGVEAPDGLPAIDSLPVPDISLGDLWSQLERATELVAEAGLV